MFFKKIRAFTRDYFTLTSRERKGALSLALIIFIQCGVIFYLNYFSDGGLEEFEKIKIEVIAFEEKQDSVNALIDARHNNFSTNVNLFPFDPNTISAEQWIQFGLSLKQAASITNYLKKGGRFRDKKDVAKMYGISPQRFKLLEPYILIPESKPIIEKEKYPLKEKFVKTVILVDINTADTTELLKLPMVGSGRARMINKYRNLLGGFNHASQLLEVFTIDSQAYNTILPHIHIDTTKIIKTNINSNELRHPYLTKTMVYAIKAYRKQHGDFKSKEDLRKLNMIDDQLFDKLAGYIDIE